MKEQVERKSIKKPFVCYIEPDGTLFCRAVSFGEKGEIAEYGNGYTFQISTTQIIRCNDNRYGLQFKVWKWLEKPLYGN